jgi:hypothetical protein
VWHVIFEPLDFLARLASLVPGPRANLTRFHGVFAANHRLRPQVVPAKRGGGAVKIIACIHRPLVVTRILQHVERASSPQLTLPPARAPP